ncbi:selenium cofactor biosynthesis protein YqeC [Vallitalea guaymasensis]|uniref:Putative selenium-dependent hydroxylase accessory protein YqeC n=1 Tax=Vallitalea guaymasensis TaxID=1185412 RepID=A0A8J8MF42_9FIRM|nr:selenium cofactor biosynthesis protein YqeC [Vallitalea guaymasensis]QUH31684.1 putative selenium-dependent hydroxylase accessory protein YqeC [Vallitalea guaymasensis]
MNLLNALELDVQGNNIISIVGAGGKTTTMYRLGNELKELDRKVLLTTTTAIYYPMSNEYDNLIISNNLEQLILESKRLSRGTITMIGKNIFHDNNKLKGIEKEWVKPLFNQGDYDFLVIEADGAKRKSIKAPTWYEPVIANCSTLVVGCIGLDIIGKRIDENWVHRANIFSRVVGKEIGDIIDYETISRLIISREGLFKGCKNHSKKVVLLNKVRDDEQLFYAQKLGEKIIKDGVNISRVIIGNVNMENPIIKIVE